MIVRLRDALQSAAETGDPLHLPGTVNCPAMQSWRWEDGHLRLRDLAGHAHVEVRLIQAGRFFLFCLDA
jgi:hypothetical protein